MKDLVLSVRLGDRDPEGAGRMGTGSFRLLLALLADESLLGFVFAGGARLIALVTLVGKMFCCGLAGRILADLPEKTFNKLTKIN